MSSTQQNQNQQNAELVDQRPVVDAMILAVGYLVLCSFSVRKSQWFLGLNQDLEKVLEALVNQWFRWFPQRA